MRISSIVFHKNPTRAQLSEALTMVFNHWPVGQYGRPCRITKIWVDRTVVGYRFHYKSIRLNRGK